MNRRSLPAFLALPALAALPLAVAGDPASQPPAPAQPPVVTPAPAPAMAPTPAPEEKVVNRVEKDNGLIIEDLVIGDGPEVPEDGLVVVHTTGLFKDGSKFYDSREMGRPMPAPLSMMMEGWRQGVPGMKKGGKRRLVIPAALAYGEKGQPPRIPPDADLTFTIDLLDLLVVEDITEGSGEPVPPGSSVTVHYKGTLDDGSVFDSNEGAEPITFPLENVIPGWQFGIPGMKKGGVRKLVVPYALAYGEQGRGPIPAKANLTFVVTLKDFQPPAGR